MTKATTSIIGIILTIIAGTFLYMYLCSSCGLPTKEEPIKEAVAPITKQATSYPFALLDGNYDCNVQDNYNFNVSSSAVLLPLSTSVSDCISSFKTFIGENTEKVINITGYYTSNETNDSAFPNLGLARANAVKNHLIEQGIPSARINTFGELKDEMIPDGNVYLGPVSYTISGEDANADAELQALYDKIKADPLVLYFETAEASINLDAVQRQKVADISRYLDKVEGAMLNVVGHTDNTGAAASNMRLGQNRAEFAKSYLLKNGIAASKINTSSQGPKQPIESNATEEGRAKNRRTVVTLN